jgi:hypothetical protein
MPVRWEPVVKSWWGGEGEKNLILCNMTPSLRPLTLLPITLPFPPSTLPSPTPLHPLLQLQTARNEAKGELTDFTAGQDRANGDKRNNNRSNRAERGEDRAKEKKGAKYLAKGQEKGKSQKRVNSSSGWILNAAALL